MQTDCAPVVRGLTDVLQNDDGIPLLSDELSPHHRSYFIHIVNTMSLDPSGSFHQIADYISVHKGPINTISAIGETLLHCATR